MDMNEAMTWAQWAAMTVQAVATVAIAFFAAATWRATSQYARVAGLTLLEDAVTKYGGGIRSPQQVYLALIRLVQKQFPKETAELEPYLPRERS